ncbi:hypothetical protein ACFL47_06520 [Candidatus Latescibacterota bacterium]
MPRTLTIVFVVVLVVLLPVQARCGSPYSANGLGFMIPDDPGISRSLGGAGTALGGGVNMMRGNPALLATFKRASYSVSTMYDNINTDMDTPENPVHSKNNLSLLKFVLPMGKGIVMSWGLSPYSRTDVTIDLESKDKVAYNDIMTTKGGINVSTFGISGSALNRIYFGASANYHFGAIEENWSRMFADSLNLHNKTDYLKKKFKGYSTTIGVMVIPVKKVYIGAGYTTQANLDLNVVLHPGNPVDPEVPVYTRKVKLPSTFRLGVASDITEKLLVAADFTHEQWEDAAVSDKEKDMYSNSYRFGGGIRFLPSTRIGAPFLLKLPLSIGFKTGSLYHKSYPTGNKVTETAVTFGFEIPLMRNIGRLYNSFEYGVRGNKSDNGWEETFFSFGLSFVGTIL